MRLRDNRLARLKISESATNFDAREVLPGAFDLRLQADLERYIATLDADTMGWVVTLYLDQRFAPMTAEKVVMGRLASAADYQFAIIERGLKLGAVGFIIICRDPSLGEQPSEMDCAAMRELRILSEDLDCYLFAAVIAGRDILKRIAL